VQFLENTHVSGDVDDGTAGTLPPVERQFHPRGPAAVKARQVSLTSAIGLKPLC
jgi:hypothetical protein